MIEHEWKFDYCHPHNGEYWYKCKKCGAADWVSRTDHLSGNFPLLHTPYETTCSKVVNVEPQVPKSGNPWKDAVLNAMRSYNMDIAHYENEPDNAVCDLLYMHANAEAHRAMMDYFSKEGDSKG